MVVVDYYFPSVRGGGVPLAVRALIAERTVSGVIVTTDHDFGVAEPHVAAARLVDDAGAIVDYVTSKRVNLWSLVLGHHPEVVVLTSPFSRRTIRLLIGRRLALLRRRTTALAPRVVMWSQGEMGARALAEKPRRKRLFLRVARRTGLLAGLSWFVVDALEMGAVETLTGLTAEHHPVGLSAIGAPQTRPDKNVGRLDLVYVGRVVERKGVHLILDALRTIEGRVRFTIIGPLEDRAYVERCNRLIDDLPPNIDARFVGAMDAQQTALAFVEHHASILATEYESFGYAIYESLAHGCVAVVSRATPFVFDGDEIGGLHVDLTAASVRAVLQQLVDEDDETLDARSGAARAFAMSMHSGDHHASVLAARLVELAS